MALASSPALESAPAVTTTVSQSTGAWMLRGQRAPICTAQGHPGSGASLLPCVLPASICPEGSARSWAVSPSALGSRAFAAGITLPGLHSPHRMEPPPQLLLGSRSPLGAEPPPELLPWPHGPLCTEPLPQLLLGLLQGPRQACAPALSSARLVVWVLSPGAQFLC